MSRGPYHIQAWEGPMLRAIADGKYQAAREDALQRYIAERERRHRHAAVRNERDKERRTLVGAHVSRELAELVGYVASQENVSTTAFVKLAIRQAVERSDSGRELNLTLGGSNYNKK